MEPTPDLTDLRQKYDAAVQVWHTLSATCTNGWTVDAATALSVKIDLAHRAALHAKRKYENALDRLVLGA